jgi:hypothetical protein
MKSLISFVLWFNLDCLFVLIILYEYRGIVDEYTLNRAANLLPRVLFVVEPISYDKNDQLVNIYSDVTLFSLSL